MEKVYFSHTSKSEGVKKGFRRPATIGLKLSSDGKNFLYGITICSKQDNFSRKIGREIVQERINTNFGCIPVPKSFDDLNDKKKCLTMLYSLSSSVYIREKKWKKAITKFNNAKF